MTEFTVASTLDRHFKRTEKPRPPDGKWHPSSLFACERQAVYEIRGVPASDPRDARSRRILRQGTNLHEMVQAAMVEDSGADVVYNEVEVQMPDLGVYGHCDTLLGWKSDVGYMFDDYELLEFKSIGVNGLRYLKGPKPEHIEQARTYAMALRLYGGTVQPDDDQSYTERLPPLGDLLQRIRWVYFCRDDLKIEEFVLPVDPEWETQFRERMARLEHYRFDGTALPPRLPLDAKGKRNWLCAGYCQFRTRCWDQDGEGEQL